MQSATDGANMAPACGGCGSSQRVAPSMHSYKGSYFCISCCNYLDDTGKVRG